MCIHTYITNLGASRGTDVVISGTGWSAQVPPGQDCALISYSDSMELRPSDWSSVERF